MKKIYIAICLHKDQVATLVKKEGFEDSISSSFEMLGILQNLIDLEKDKIKFNRENRKI